MTQSFSHSAAKIYNSLLRHLKRKQALEENFDTVRVVEEFKKQLDNFLTTQPDQPTTPTNHTRTDKGRRDQFHSVPS